MVNGLFTVRSLLSHDRHVSLLLLGDRKHLNEAKKSIHDYYRDLPVTMEDLHQRTVSIV